MRTVLRGLVRRRCYVRAGLRSGETLGGTLDAVGADHVELAAHDADVPRRPGQVRAVDLILFGACAGGYGGLNGCCAMKSAVSSYRRWM